ncbi:hypothetical protein IPM62_00165 [Candidatus Woesebacteria bacterium]|nr:MAG: hypothetical protein IPM62_00165 [Candidatus Woesebacteria bacterium]
MNLQKAKKKTRLNLRSLIFLHPLKRVRVKNAHTNTFVKHQKKLTNKTDRFEKVRRRKNFFPSLLINIILWVMWITFVYSVEPDTILAIPLFFVLTFLCLLFTISFLLINTQRGVLISTIIVVFLVLRYLGVGNLLNLLLLTGLYITYELYVN